MLSNCHGGGDDGRAGHPVPGLWQRHMHAVAHVRHPLALELQVNPRSKESIAGSCPDCHDPILVQRTHLQNLCSRIPCPRQATRGKFGSLHPHCLNRRSVRLRQVFPSDRVQLVRNDQQRLGCEQGADGVEQGGLLLDGVAALLRHVQHVQHRRPQVCQRRDTLHLDRVALLKRPIQDAGRVYHLPAQVSVIHVPHEQALCCEGIRLHLHVCPCHLVHEGGLADIGVAAHQQGAGGGVNGRQPPHVLPHLLQIRQARPLPLHQRAHPAQSCALQLLAAV
mmetsp:Transcript_20611/g.62060  ORF Transcript_20611/g.62060 Transcript_20611/m.62060 type:complete len:279 (+) Transcript_20611:965-1801(+)